MTPQDQLSIHPRVEDGRTVHRKVDTCKPWRRQGKGKLGARQARLAARRKDHSDTIRGIKRPEGYRVPGSMNRKK